MTSVPLDSPHVLIIDDDAAIRMVLCDALEDVGCIVVAASSGQAGLEAFQSFQPNLILLDALMPGMNGFTTCARIRATPEGRTIPILMSTALNDEASIDRAFKAGATDFVPKPFNLTVLTHRVRRLADAGQAQASLHVLQRAIDSTTHGILITDARLPDNPIISVNPALEKLTGYPANELRGRNCRMLQGPDTDPSSVAAIRTAIDHEREVHVELLNYRKDGIPFWNALSIMPVRDTWGRLTHFVGVQQDVSERVYMEQALRESEALFRHIVETAREGIWVVDHEQRTTYINQRMADLLGYSTADLLGRCMMDFFDAEYQFVSTWISGHNASPQPHRSDVRLRCADGSALWAIVAVNPILDHAGDVTGALAMVTDITARKQAEAIVRESEARFRGAFTQTAVGTAILDADDRYIQVNPALCAMIGYAEDELIGQHTSFIIHPDDHQGSRDYLHEVLASTNHTDTLEQRYLRRDGTVLWGLVSLSVIRDDDGTVRFRVCQVQDITARKEAEMRLSRSEEQLRFAQQVGQIGSWEWDIQTNTVSWSQEWLRIFDVPRMELGRFVETIMARIHVEDRARMRETIMSTITSHASLHEEHRIVTSDNQERYVEARVEPVFDEQGQAVRMYGTVQDITTRKLAEKSQERLTMRLRHLHQIVRSVQAVQPSLDIVATTLNKIRVLVSCQLADLALMSDDNVHATVLATDIAGESSVRVGGRAPMEALGLIPDLRKSTVVFINDLVAHTNYSDEVLALRTMGVRSMVVVPLIAQQTLIGALTLGSDTVGAFADEDVAIAREIADVLAVAIHNTQIYGREQHARVVAEALQSASLDLTKNLDLTVVLRRILEHLERLVPYDSARVLLLDDMNFLVKTVEHGTCLTEKNLTSQRFDPQESTVFRRILAEQSAMLIPEMASQALSDFPETAEYARNWLGVPLSVAGTVIGVYVVDKAVPGFFTAEHVRLAEAFASHAALAIQNSKLFVSIAASRERLHRLSQQLIGVQEQERRHIARELHDQIGQMLTAIKMNLQLVSRNGQYEELDDTMDLVGQVLADVRDLSLELRPSLLDDFGLESALRWYVDREGKRAGYQVHVITSNLKIHLPQWIEITCYRIVQEALTNASRHAHASEVVIELCDDQHEIMLSVQDDGEGFDVVKAQESASKGNSLGLLSMRERAELIGGTLTVRSKPGAGTVVNARFPLVGPDSDE